MRGLVKVLVVIAALACVPTAHAQLDAFGFVASSDPMLAGTPEEREALAALDGGKMIKARELSEKVLVTSPDSFIAEWVLSQVFHLEEGHYPRALFFLDKAMARLLEHFGKEPTDEAAQLWHKRLLLSLAEIQGSMEDREGQVATLDAYDALYAPKSTRHRIWPLMKMGRYAEAIAAAQTLLRADDLVDRISAYNGLMAIEDERLDRLASYNWGKAGIENTQNRSCILFHNTAQSALTLFKFEEAEELARKAIRADYDDCPNSTYEHLVSIYLAEGQFQKAISAFKKLARYPIEPRYRPMFDKNNKFYIAEILFLLGKFPEGEKLAEIVFTAPDRTGMTSVSLDDIRFGHATMYWLALEMSVQAMKDEASVRGLGAFMGRQWKTKSLEIKQWELSRILLRLGVKDDILVTNLRPFLRGVRPWWAGSLGKILGTGLVRAALTEAQDLDEPQLGDAGHGYFDSLFGEMSFIDGDWDEAIRLGEKALSELQKQNALLRWRTMAYVAGSYAQRGEPTAPAAVAAFREVLQDFPSALRHLQVALPVSITFDDGDFLEEVADGLLDSRRFTVMTSGAPFVIHVGNGQSHAVEICLSAADGFRVGCVEKEIDPEADDAAGLVIDNFVNEILSPKIAFTSTDINSLDGSTVRQTSDKALEGILGNEFKPKLGDDDE